MDEKEGLDPELARQIAAVEGVPEWHTVSVESARRLEDDLFGADRTTPVAYTRDVAVDGPHGPITVRAIRPDAEGTLPTVVFCHGGLWALGTLDSVEDICRDLAARVPAVVLAVDYRLAPEHPFPQGLDDCIAAYAWAREHASAFGGDPDRVHVAGTSAGGNLAAGVARHCRDLDLPAPERQALLYPMIDDDFGRDSYREHGDGPLLTRAAVEHFWGQYLRSSVDRANPYVAPLQGDQSGLAPATLVTAGVDPLRDEGDIYAATLESAGVAVEHRRYPAACHGFLSFAGEAAVADDALDAVAADLR